MWSRIGQDRNNIKQSILLGDNSIFKKSSFLKLFLDLIFIQHVKEFRLKRVPLLEIESQFQPSPPLDTVHTV